MDNIKTWANTHSWVKIAVYLLTFLFPALAFAQFSLPLQSPVNPYCLIWIGFYSCLSWDFCFSVLSWVDFMEYFFFCIVFVSLHCLCFSCFDKSTLLLGVGKI